ncbi:tyrosine-type recombinase/integrase [Kiritimatiellota bacterium B12222]|nr:tyrosine-type recombinase/integrase [Kiritimatiellota bacterium B12222]
MESAVKPESHKYPATNPQPPSLSAQKKALADARAFKLAPAVGLEPTFSLYSKGFFSFYVVIMLCYYSRNAFYMDKHELRRIMANKRQKGSGSIVKLSNGGYGFQVIGANGKRKTTSLKTKNLREAKQKAKGLTRVAVAEDTIEAMTIISDAKNNINRRPLPLADTWDLFLETNPTCGAGTLKMYKTGWNKFAKWIQENRPGVDDLADLTPETAQHFLDAVVKSGLSDSRYNDIRCGCGRICNEIHIRNPWVKDNIFPTGKNAVRKGPQQEKKPFTAEQQTLLIEATRNTEFEYPEEWPVLFALGLYAGMRLKDAALLKRENVRDGLIEYKPFKTVNTSGAEVKVPILPALKEALQPVMKNQDYLLPGIAHEYNHCKSWVDKRTQKIVIQAVGKVEQTAKTQRKQTRSPYGFHSLRHTFTVCAALSGVPVGLLKQMTGDNIGTLDKYYAKAGALDISVLSPAYRSIGTSGSEREELKALADNLSLKAVRFLLKTARGIEA